MGVLEVLKMSAVYVDPEEPYLISHPLSTDSVLPTIYVVIRVVTNVFDQSFALVAKYIRSPTGGAEFRRQDHVPIRFNHANLEILFRATEMSEYEIEADEIEVIVVNGIVAYFSGKYPVSKIDAIGVLCQ